MLQGMANGIVYLLSRKHWLIYHGVQCWHREPVKTAVPPQLESSTQPGHTVTPTITQQGNLPHIPKRTLRRRF